MGRVVRSTVISAGLIAAAVVGYGRLKSGVLVDIYQDRFHRARRDYTQLLDAYNQAVRKTAVTELRVDGGSLSVVVRTAEGVQRVIETPLDPYGEVYVDYVVLDGRLWIRRVFDEHTPPDKAVVIDPGLQSVAWDAAPGAVGKAVYRKLDEGRWVITVTGDGSLGLVRAGEPAEPGGPGVREGLNWAPRVREYDLAEEQGPAPKDGVTLGEVLRRVIGQDPDPPQGR